jgi:uncharacterized protein (TIGR02466 family)
MIHIEQWFPVYIGYVINPFHKEIEDELTQECLKIKKSYKKDFEKFRKEDINDSSASALLDWFHFISLNTNYKLLKDQKFNKLHNWIDEQINIYAEKLESCKEGRLKCIDGWFNVYEKYEHADFHCHRGSAFSCVYFLNCEENTGAKLLFKSGRSGKSYSEDPFVFHEPFPGKLVIFSSYLDHAVQQHNTDNLRITLAYNYREI